MSTDTVQARDGDLNATGAEVITIDQATGDELARYPVAGSDQVAAAVAVARQAAVRWWGLGFKGRADRLRAWRREVALGGDRPAELIHAENGKSVEDGRAEVLAILGHLTFVIDHAEGV